jgi:hypothetical protein
VDKKVKLRLNLHHNLPAIHEVRKCDESQSKVKGMFSKFRFLDFLALFFLFAKSLNVSQLISQFIFQTLLCPSASLLKALALISFR